MSSWESFSIARLHAVCVKPVKPWCPTWFAQKCEPFVKCLFFSLLLELKVSLSNFIEKETILDYDREAELALQRLTAGDVDVNQLTNAWTRSYVEVRGDTFHYVIVPKTNIHQSF